MTTVVIDSKEYDVPEAVAKALKDAQKKLKKVDDWIEKVDPLINGVGIEDEFYQLSDIMNDSPVRLKEERVTSLESAKTCFKLPYDLVLGQPTSNVFIEHPILFRMHEDDLVDIKVGYLTGDTYYVYPELLRQAEAIHKRLTRFIESGDHNGILTLSLLTISDGTHRIYGEQDEDDEPFEINANSIEDLMEEFKSQTQM